MSVSIAEAGLPQAEPLVEAAENHDPEAVIPMPQDDVHENFHTDRRLATAAGIAEVIKKCPHLRERAELDKEGTERAIGGMVLGASKLDALKQSLQPKMTAASTSSERKTVVDSPPKPVTVTTTEKPVIQAVVPNIDAVRAAERNSIPVQDSSELHIANALPDTDNVVTATPTVEAQQTRLAEELQSSAEKDTTSETMIAAEKVRPDEAEITIDLEPDEITIVPIQAEIARLSAETAAVPPAESFPSSEITSVTPESERTLPPDKLLKITESDLFPDPITIEAELPESGMSARKSPESPETLAVHPAQAAAEDSEEPLPQELSYPITELSEVIVVPEASSVGPAAPESVVMNPEGNLTVPGITEDYEPEPTAVLSLQQQLHELMAADHEIAAPIVIEEAEKTIVTDGSGEFTVPAWPVAIEISPETVYSNFPEEESQESAAVPLDYFIADLAARLTEVPAPDMRHEALSLEEVPSVAINVGEVVASIKAVIEEWPELTIETEDESDAVPTAALAEKLLVLVHSLGIEKPDKAFSHFLDENGIEGLDDLKRSLITIIQYDAGDKKELLYVSSGSLQADDDQSRLRQVGNLLLRMIIPARPADFNLELAG